MSASRYTNQRPVPVLPRDAGGGGATAGGTTVLAASGVGWAAGPGGIVRTTIAASHSSIRVSNV